MMKYDDPYDPHSPFNVFLCLMFTFMINLAIAFILAIITRKWLLISVSTVKLTLFYLLAKLYIMFKIRFLARTDI